MLGADVPGNLLCIDVHTQSSLFANSLGPS